MEQLSAWMDEINLLSASDEMETPADAEKPDSDFPTGGR
jgi:hypothetical protein